MFSKRAVTLKLTLFDVRLLSLFQRVLGSPKSNLVSDLRGQQMSCSICGFDPRSVLIIHDHGYVIKVTYLVVFGTPSVVYLYQSASTTSFLYPITTTHAMTRTRLHRVEGFAMNRCPQAPLEAFLCCWATLTGIDA